MRVLFFASYTFPLGSPGALRNYSLIRAMQMCGHEVTVVCDEKKGFDLSPYGSTIEVYNNIKIYSLKCNYGRVKRKLAWITPGFLTEILNKEKPDIVFSSSLREKEMNILRICKRASIPVILESCENYHPSTFKYGRYNWNYIVHRFCWKWVYPKVNGVIAISRYLEKHYRQYTDNVIRVPTILDVEAVPYSIKIPHPEKIRLLFAGSMARTKDSILPFVEAIDRMGDDGQAFEIHVCGETAEAVELHLGSELFERNQQSIVCYGRLPQEKINEMYQNCDFGIFFRPHIWSSEAGFSTKLGEGMSAGAPFIINDTGDISLYIHSGENGFVIKDESTDGVIRILRNVLHMTLQQREDMRRKARESAEIYFNAKNYASAINGLIERIYRGV